MKALIIGATGATGKCLVNVLLHHPAYTAVVIFVRRPSGITHPKLLEVIADFDKLEDVSQKITGDVWFSCLGTTLKAAGSEEKQWHVDYGIPLQFATIAKRNGVPSAVLLSAYGASASSRVFYSRMKGELEDKIASLSFNQYIVFRPGLLMREATDRAGERISAAVLQFLNKLGLVKKFKPMPTALLAEKMAKAPAALANGKHVIELDTIFNF